MPSFVKKLASKAAKKAINKVVDNVTGKIFDGFGGGPGRIVTFGQRETDPRFQSPKGLIDYRGVFHTQLTENWNYITPNRSLWYVVINGFPISIDYELLKTLEKTTVDGYTTAQDYHNTEVEYESIVGTGKSIPGHENLHEGSSELQNLHIGNQMTGCLFAQGCQIPQESMNYSRAGVNQMRGFIPGVVASQRNEFNPLVLEFRETNTSFVDIVLRPWIILASHYGLVTYPKADIKKNIKTQVDIYQLALGNNRHAGHVIRKKFSFYNCVPFQIAQQSATHDVDAGSVPPVDTSWMYSHYSFETSVDSSIMANQTPGSVVEDGSGMAGFGTPDTNQAGGSLLDSAKGAIKSTAMDKVRGATGGLFG